MNLLLSKVSAAGLAAGVFLLWWPTHLPASGLQWLVLRGVAWTLAFEVLLLAFSPLERMARRALARRRAARRARDVRSLIAAAPTPARAGGAVLLACAGALLPVLLLAHVGRPAAHAVRQPRPTVVRKVIVRRQIVRRETVVVRTVPAAAPAVVPAPERPATVPARTAPVHAAAPKASVDSTTVTGTAPAETVAPVADAPQPTTTAATTPSG